MGTEGNTAELAILALAALAGAVLASLWAGAALACLVAGHGALGVGLAGAARALPRLVGHPGSPAGAWAAPASGRLPGAVVYWACTAPAVAAMVAVVFVVGAVISRHRSVGLERRSRMGLNPEARFARAKDVVALWVRRPTSRRVVLGRVHGHLVATEDARLGLAEGIPRRLRHRAQTRRGDRGAIVVLGPTRCGKTTALAVPAILEWEGPVIALSVKSDLMGATIAARRRRGEVKVFDPGDATAEETSFWSPLRAAGTLNGAKKAARALANATDWSAGSGDMAFWVAGAEDLLAPLLWVAARNNLYMSYVVSWVLTMDRPREADTDGPPDAKTVRPHDAKIDPDDKGKGSMVATLVEALCSSDDPLVAADAAAASELLSGTWGLDFRQVSSVYVTAKAMISAWQDPPVALSSRGEPIDLVWLLGGPDVTVGAPGSAGGGNTVFLCAPLHEAQRLAPVLGGLLGDLIDQCYERVGKSNEPVGPILVVVDEAGNWPLRNLAALASTCAGIGIQLLLVYQSKAQIDAVYGRQADTIISNCLTKVFFAGLSDRSTLDYAESLLGSEQVLDRHSSVDVGVGGGRRSLSHSTTRAELLPMALLRQVRPGEALLIHNTLPPAHLIGRYWFKDPSLHLAATGEPLRRWPFPKRADTATSPGDEPCATCAGTGAQRRVRQRRQQTTVTTRPCPTCRRRRSPAGTGGSR